jgi:peptide-methionine (S)-S-oxide reductase
MSNRMKRSAILAALLALPLALGVPAPAPAAGNQTVVLAGGCFWGMEAVFGALRGVTSSVPGYAGGKKENARYDTVSSGTTGHAESVQVTFDPAKISYEQILDVYFRVAHDPTELNRQGPDEGTQYRSAIFYADEGQRRRAETVIRTLTAAHRFSSPIVTKLEPLHGFYRAEPEHLNFVARNPNYPYVVINDLPKITALRKTFPALIRT